MNIDNVSERTRQGQDKDEPRFFARVPNEEEERGGGLQTNLSILLAIPGELGVPFLEMVEELGGRRRRRRRSRGRGRGGSR